MMTKDFLESWSHELTSRASRVRNLIGSAHWPSDGFHKEYLVRETLSRIVQPPVHVSTGFIRSLNGEVSPEIDVLVYSSTLGFPYFTEGDLTILPPRLALGAIEVKSKWSSEALANVLQKSHKTMHAATSGRDTDIQLWMGAVFFEGPSNPSAGSLLKTLAIKIQHEYKGSEQTTPINSFKRSLPKTISILGNCVIFLKPSDSQSTIKLTAFAADQLSFAVQLSDFLGHVYSVVNNSPDILEIEQELNHSAEFTRYEKQVELR